MLATVKLLQAGLRRQGAAAAWPLLSTWERGKKSSSSPKGPNNQKQASSSDKRQKQQQRRHENQRIREWASAPTWKQQDGNKFVHVDFVDDLDSDSDEEDHRGVSEAVLRAMFGSARGATGKCADKRAWQQVEEEKQRRQQRQWEAAFQAQQRLHQQHEEERAQAEQAKKRRQRKRERREAEDRREARQMEEFFEHMFSWDTTAGGFAFAGGSFGSGRRGFAGYRGGAKARAKQRKASKQQQEEFSYEFYVGGDGAQWEYYSDDYEEEEEESEEDLQESMRLLGLQKGQQLTEERLKAAFRTQALTWHPDRHQGDAKAGAEAKFKAVQHAYQSLKKHVT